MKINYRLTAPLSHIGETASTGSYFQTILTASGRIPVITGNSIRGVVRDYGAIHLLDLLKQKVDKEVFHVLFSGGNISESMKNDVQKAYLAREYFPLISVLGGGLGDMILAGKTSFSFAYPICKESEFITGIKSDVSWHSLIEEVEFSRMDDSKNNTYSKYIIDLDAKTTGKASTQMRYSVQYMCAGTDFVQEIKTINCTDIEIGALYAAIAKWFTCNPVLGGMTNKGFGFFDAEVDDNISLINGKAMISDKCKRLIHDYEDYISNHDIVNNFNLLKGVRKSGKSSNKTAKDNSNID